MSNPVMKTFFTAMWLTVLVRGIASVAFGIFAFFYPGVTLGLLVTVFGIYAVIDGLASLWGIFRGRSTGLTAILQALASLAAGAFCLALPGMAAIYLVFLIGLWNIAVGLLQVAGAMVLRKDIGSAGLLAAGGALSALLGVLILLYPAGSAVSIIWIIAGAAVLVGLVLMVFAFNLRRVGQTLAG